MGIISSKIRVRLKRPMLYYIFFVIAVIAHDEDQGSNGEIRYSFGSDAGDIVNVFAIDAYTGWITSLVELDKEQRAEYKFHVIAADNGTPKHSARTTVIIRLKDYNDSPTVFKQPLYESEIREDALPGTVVLTLDVTDADTDLTTPVEFYIIGGDLSSQFHIRKTGELYVAKPLDRETVASYNLDVVVTDGLFTHSTKVSIRVLDANGKLMIIINSLLSVIVRSSDCFRFMSFLNCQKNCC